MLALLPRYTRPLAALQSIKTSRSAPCARRLASTMSLPGDVREFLEGYPRIPDEPSLNANLEFYKNVRRCKPDNLLIDTLHEQ